MSDLYFVEIEDEYRRYESARAVILPIPYEETTTYLRGARNGPEAILRASQALELYDEELDAEPFRNGVHTAPAPDFTGKSETEAVDVIERAASGLLDDGKFIIGLGGEHTVSVGLIRAQVKVRGPLTVVVLDAHADLRNEYLGSPYNHACVMRRVRETGCNIIQIGLRSLDMEDVLFAKESGIRRIYAHELHREPESWKRMIEHICGPVYLSVDLDAFDPGVMPAVGTPEPGGLGWYAVLDILHELFRRCDVVGGDVVELCPRKGLEYSDFTAAKLVYKMIGYRFHS